MCARVWRVLADRWNWRNRWKSPQQAEPAADAPGGIRCTKREFANLPAARPRYATLADNAGSYDACASGKPSCKGSRPGTPNEALLRGVGDAGGLPRGKCLPPVRNAL